MSDPAIEFVGVYDADSTLIGEISYWIKARLGREHCSLCELTHGLFTTKREWRECSTALGVPVTTWHRNDAPADVLAVAAGIFPVVLVRRQGRLSVLLDRDALDQLDGSTADFVRVLEAELLG